MEVKCDLKQKGGNHMFAVFTVLFFTLSLFATCYLENWLTN